ncbi:20122_t:CDS:2 [Entrophospora sp. SA101]|nr:20122_t:CDS:2 [Entrophospora sp. SA101]
MTVAINTKVLNNSQNQLQLIHDKYDDNSLWSKIRKGPLGFSLYAALQYPKVFLNRFFFDNTLNPTWTIYQESFINVLKWTLDAPLTTIRSNFIFLEYIMKHFGCSEPYTLLDDDEDIKGYWLGPELWKGRHPEAVILYVHGGHVAMSSFFGIRFLCYLIKQLRIQHDIHIRVLSVDYSLAPEEPFPSGINCIKRAYKWLTEEVGTPKNQKVFLCGDSSGAKFSSSFKKKHPLAGVILISPWVELACDKLSCLTNSKYDYLPSQFTSVSAENYLFGNVGNPNRFQDSYRPTVNEPLILSWLEKVEDSFDYVGIDDPNYYNLLSPSSRISKRYSIESRSTNNRFSMHSQRNSKSSFKNLGSSFRNSKIRIDSSSSFMVNSYLNNNNGKGTTKNHIYSSTNNTNEEFNELDTTTRQSSTHHRITLHQIIEKNKRILAKFPPLFISYGGKEIFKDDIEMFCKKCIESKNYFGGSVPNHNKNSHPDVTIEIDPEMVHAYPIFVDAFGKHSKNTLNRIASFISSKVYPSRLSTSLSFHHNNIRRSRRNPNFVIKKSLTPTILLLSGDNSNDNGKGTNYLIQNKSLSKITPNSRILRKSSSNLNKKNRKSSRKTH